MNSFRSMFITLYIKMNKVERTEKFCIEFNLVIYKLLQLVE